MFFFPTSLHPPFSPSLFVRSCRQCTLTLAYLAHKSPKPDILLNILINPISIAAHMAQLQCKPAKGTLLKKKTAVILSSTQSTLQEVTPSNTHTHTFKPVQTCPAPDVSHAQVCFPPRERETDQIKQTERGRMSCIRFHSSA